MIRRQRRRSSRPVEQVSRHKEAPDNDGDDQQQESKYGNAAAAVEGV
jgi:hypothetical protein